VHTRYYAEACGFPMESLLGELISRYETIAIGFVRGRLKDDDAARDVYQDVLSALVESSREFESLEHMRNYFFVALRNPAAESSSSWR